MATRLIRITDEEAIALIKKGIVTRAKFGPGWLALEWEEGEPMPESVREIGLMRGVLNENMHGAGI